MFSPLLIAFLCGGLLPALIWLSYWLFEDRRSPEPKKYIFFAFLAGMAIVVPVVLPLEKLVQAQAAFIDYPKEGVLVLFFWALIEETFKFAAAYVAALRWRVFDEPIDAVIYMITVALGFAALENTLFLTQLVGSGQLQEFVTTGTLRFLGATLLHTLASGTVGVMLAYAFYKKPAVRRKAAVVGVILATALHTLFNFFILTKGGGATFVVFLTLWLGIVALLLFIERIKRPTYNYR